MNNIKKSLLTALIISILLTILAFFVSIVPCTYFGGNCPQGMACAHPINGFCHLSLFYDQMQPRYFYVRIFNQTTSIIIFFVLTFIISLIVLFTLFSLFNSQKQKP